MPAARFVEVAQLPAPSVLAPRISLVMDRTGQRPISLYRGTDPQGTAILHRHHGHNQAELRHAWETGHAAELGIVGVPDRPGTSTHELRSDGVAVPGPVGRPIPDWQCGQDWPDSSIPAVMAAYRAIGELPIHPYSSGLEYHHIILGHAPRAAFAIYSFGDRGPRVLRMTQLLVDCGYLPRRYFHFNRPVHGAVAAFQRRHHLQIDGVVGQHTYLQLQAASRACLKHHKKEARP